MRIAFYQQMNVIRHFSISNNSELVSAHTSAIISFSRTSTLDTNTGLRYFGHHTTWYLHEKMILQLDLVLPSNTITCRKFKEKRGNPRLKSRGLCFSGQESPRDVGRSVDVKSEYTHAHRKNIKYKLC